MKIAPLRDRLTFEVRKIVVDEIGNESSVWNTVFQRWCSSRPLTLTENEGSMSKLLYNKIQFTLRYDKAVLNLSSLKARIKYRDVYFTIDSIDGDSVSRQLIYIVATKENDYEQNRNG